MADPGTIPPPPDGSAIIAQGAIPPPPDGSSIVAAPQSLTQKLGAKVAHMGQGLWNAAEQTASTPAVATEMYKKFTGQPNQLAEMPGRAALTFATAEEPVRELETQPSVATAAQPSAAAATAQTIAGKILRRIPYLGKVVQLGDLASDIADAIGG